MDYNSVVTNIECFQGNVKTYKIEVTNNNVPEDITGYIVFFTVKENASDDDEDAIISKTVVCGDTEDSHNGIAYIILTSTDTDIQLGEYFYDFKIQKNDGELISIRCTISTGKFKVNRSITTRRE